MAASCSRGHARSRGGAGAPILQHRRERGIGEAAAIEILNERPVIALDDEAWDAFIAPLDAPVELDPAVKERYARTPQWDR